MQVYPLSTPAAPASVAGSARNGGAVPHPGARCSKGKYTSTTATTQAINAELLPDNTPACERNVDRAIEQYALTRQSAVPPGCSADAIKLFVGNLPKHLRERQVEGLFCTVGTVVRVTLACYGNTNKSKGSAFIWFARRSDARRAILGFHGQVRLPKCNNELGQTLTVRPADNPVNRQPGGADPPFDGSTGANWSLNPVAAGGGCGPGRSQAGGAGPERPSDVSQRVQSVLAQLQQSPALVAEGPPTGGDVQTLTDCLLQTVQLLSKLKLQQQEPRQHAPEQQTPHRVSLDAYDAGDPGDGFSALGTAGPGGPDWSASKQGPPVSGLSTYSSNSYVNCNLSMPSTRLENCVDRRCDQGTAQLARYLAAALDPAPQHTAAAAPSWAVRGGGGGPPCGGGGPQVSRADVQALLNLVPATCLSGHGSEPALMVASDTSCEMEASLDAVQLGIDVPGQFGARGVHGGKFDFGVGADARLWYGPGYGGVQPGARGVTETQREGRTSASVEAGTQLWYSSGVTSGPASGPPQQAAATVPLAGPRRDGGWEGFGQIGFGEETRSGRCSVAFNGRSMAQQR